MTLDFLSQIILDALISNKPWMYFKWFVYRTVNWKWSGPSLSSTTMVSTYSWILELLLIPRDSLQVRIYLENLTNSLRMHSRLSALLAQWEKHRWKRKIVFFFRLTLTFIAHPWKKNGPFYIYVLLRIDFLHWNENT